MSEYVKEYITWMDAHNQVCADDNAYTLRLKKLTEGLGDADGIPLNFKVYYVKDVNAFACADGSVRVFSSLMDIMSDEELLSLAITEIIREAVGDVPFRVDTQENIIFFWEQVDDDIIQSAISSLGDAADRLNISNLHNENNIFILFEVSQ